MINSRNVFCTLHLLSKAHPTLEWLDVEQLSDGYHVFIGPSVVFHVVDTGIVDVLKVNSYTHRFA
jgi:predicted nucleotidyltransferase